MNIALILRKEKMDFGPNSILKLADVRIVQDYISLPYALIANLIVKVYKSNLCQLIKTKSLELV